jgi:hypothetical protein
VEFGRADTERDDDAQTQGAGSRCERVSHLRPASTKVAGSVLNLRRCFEAINHAGVRGARFSWLLGSVARRHPDSHFFGRPELFTFR